MSMRCCLYSQKKQSNKAIGGNMAFFKLKKKLVEGVDKILGKDKILEMIAPLPDIEKHTRFLFVGPHPDDIEIGADRKSTRLNSSHAT